MWAGHMIPSRSTLSTGGKALEYSKPRVRSISCFKSIDANYNEDDFTQVTYYPLTLPDCTTKLLPSTNLTYLPHYQPEPVS